MGWEKQSKRAREVARCQVSVQWERKAKPSASRRHGTVRHGTAGRDRMGLLREELRAPRCSVRAEANRVEPSLIEPS